MSSPASKWKWLKRSFFAFAALSIVSVGYLLQDAWVPLGHTPTTEELTQYAKSPAFRGDHFENLLPTNQPQIGKLFSAYWNNHAITTPTDPLPVVFRKKEEFNDPELRVTWLGHSTLLIEIDGKRVLTDPVWGERTSPLTHFGPTRFHPPPLPWGELPSLDAIVISHDHYDHLDAPTIAALRDSSVRFIVPLGIGGHLEYWGIPRSRITELDWWQNARVGELEIVSTPSRHFSGRGLARDKTLWTGFALLGPRHRVYYSGDTSMFPGFREIGERLGPFDLTMIEAGAYNALWADVHLGPEQAVEAHVLVRGKRLIPVHWGTFNLALHAWTEPPERVLVAARKKGVDVAVPRPGESVTLDAAPHVAWWPSIPWQSAAESPARSSHLEGLELPPDVVPDAH